MATRSAIPFRAGRGGSDRVRWALRARRARDCERRARCPSSRIAFARSAICWPARSNSATPSSPSGTPARAGPSAITSASSPLWRQPCVPSTASDPGSRVAILGCESVPSGCSRHGRRSPSAGTVVAMNGWWQGDEIRYGLELAEPELSHYADRGTTSAPRGARSGHRDGRDRGRLRDAYQRFRSQRAAFRSPDRRGRSRRHHVHERNDGPAQGRDDLPPQLHRLPHALVHERRGRAR